MGTTIGSATNPNKKFRNVALGPSDSEADTAAQVAERTDPSQPQSIRQIWAGATYISADLPVGAVANSYKFESGSLVKLDTLQNIENLRVAARQVIDFYDLLANLLKGREANLWRSTVRIKGEDIIAEMHRATLIIIGRRVTSVQNLTIAQRITWCQQMLLGPTDTRRFRPDDLESRIHAVFSTLAKPQFPATTSPFTYINPINGTAVSLSDAHDLSSTTLGLNSPTDPSGSSINFAVLDVNGSWLETVMA